MGKPWETVPERLGSRESLLEASTQVGSGVRGDLTVTPFSLALPSLHELLPDFLLKELIFLLGVFYHSSFLPPKCAVHFPCRSYIYWQM